MTAPSGAAFTSGMKPVRILPPRRCCDRVHGRVVKPYRKWSRLDRHFPCNASCMNERAFIVFIEKLLHACNRCLAPMPMPNILTVYAVAVRIGETVVLLIAHCLRDGGGARVETGHQPNRIDDQAEAVDVILYRKLQRCIDTAALDVAANMQMAMAAATVSQSVNQPGIAMKIEQDRPIAARRRRNLYPRTTAHSLDLKHAAWLQHARPLRRKRTVVPPNTSSVSQALACRLLTAIRCGPARRRVAPRYW